MIRPPIHVFLALFLLLPFSASAARMEAANRGVDFSTMDIRKDIAYDGQSWQKLDLYLPKQVGAKPLPLIVFFHGGRWSHGSKGDFAFIAESFTQLGYAVAIPDFAAYPASVFPTFIEDAASAIAWLHNHAGEYGIDAGRLFVLGHSSGAHIAALVASDPHYLESRKGQRGWIAAVVGLAGPYDLTPDEPDLIAMFGPPERYAQMQVPTFIDGGQPPMLLLTGGKDEVVEPEQLEKVREAVKAKGGVLQTHAYPELNHGELVMVFSRIKRDKAPVIQDIHRFLSGIGGKGG